MSRPSAEVSLAPADDRPAALTVLFASALGLLAGIRGVESGLRAALLNADGLLDELEYELWVSDGINAIFAIPLLIGGVLIVLRKKISRALLGIGGIGALAATATQFALNYHVDPSLFALIMTTKLVIGVTALQTSATLAMLVLIFLPSTSRWLARPGDSSSTAA